MITVEPLISHTPRWIARAMGYERLWVLRGQLGSKFQFGSGLNLWGMEGYGLWVMGGMGYESFDCTSNNDYIGSRTTSVDKRQKCHNFNCRSGAEV